MTEITKVLENLPTGDLVRIYNKVSTTPVKKFENFVKALRRTTAAVEASGRPLHEIMKSLGLDFEPEAPTPDLSPNDVEIEQDPTDAEIEASNAEPAAEPITVKWRAPGGAEGGGTFPTIEAARAFALLALDAQPKRTLTVKGCTMAELLPEPPTPALGAPAEPPAATEQLTNAYGEPLQTLLVRASISRQVTDFALLMGLEERPAYLTAFLARMDKATREPAERKAGAAKAAKPKAPSEKRPSDKQQIIIDLCLAEGGATAKEILAAVGWPSIAAAAVLKGLGERYGYTSGMTPRTTESASRYWLKKVAG